MKKLLTIALCALFAVHAAEARTLYVNAKAKNNKGNGLKLATAKKTIQAAINIAKAGDTILVYPGTYAPIKTSNKKITIKAIKGKAKTKINARNAKKSSESSEALAQLGKSWLYRVNWDGRYLYRDSSPNSRGNNTVLQGFLLDGLYHSGYSGATGGVVRNCTIRNIGQTFLTSYGDRYYTYASGANIVANSRVFDTVLTKNLYVTTGGTLVNSCTLSRCIVKRNFAEGGCDAAINGSSLYNCLIEGNTIGKDKWHGADHGFFHKSTLLNCTIVNNVVSLGENKDSCYHFSTDSKYYNCILRNNYGQYTWLEYPWYWYGTPLYDEDGNPIRETYDESTGNWVSTGWWGDSILHVGKPFVHNAESGNIYKNTDKTNKNPKFTSAYKLKKGSFAINKGKLTKAQKKLVGSKDLAGKKRINGKAIDLGCYEY